MPYADPEKRRQNSKRWREKKIAEGYGRALYARRAQRYRNEEILREALLTVDSMVSAGSSPGSILKTIEEALKEASPVDKPINYMPKEGE